MPISNSYQAYNTDGPNGSFNTTDPASSFAYWTDPVYDTAKHAEPRARHQPEHGLLAGAAGHRGAHRDAEHRSPRRPGCRSPGPAATWARSPRRTRSWRTPRRTSPRCSAPTRRKPSSWPPTRTRSRTPETADYVGLGRALRPGQRLLRHAKAVEVRADHPVADRGVRRAAGRAGRLQRVPGAVRAPVRRAAARRGHAEPVAATGTRSPTRPGTWSTRTATRSTARSSPTTPASPGSARINASQALAYMADMLESGVPVVNGYIADIHGNEDIPGLAACKGAPDGAGQRHRRATSRRRSTTTPRSAPSSSGWPPTASTPPTRCSCSARTRATTRPAPTSAGPSSPPRPTATA